MSFRIELRLTRLDDRETNIRHLKITLKMDELKCKPLDVCTQGAG